MTLFTDAAAHQGRADALAVNAGTMTMSEAGDKWVAYADQNYDAGVAYMTAYDATVEASR